MPAPTPAEAEDQLRTRTAVHLTTACVALGVSPATGSGMVAAGTFPVPVIRMGTRVVVPTPPLRQLLHVGDAGDAAARGDAA